MIIKGSFNYHTLERLLAQNDQAGENTRQAIAKAHLFEALLLHAIWRGGIGVAEVEAYAYYTTRYPQLLEYICQTGRYCQELVAAAQRAHRSTFYIQKSPGNPSCLLCTFSLFPPPKGFFHDEKQDDQPIYFLHVEIRIPDQKIIGVIHQNNQ